MNRINAYDTKGKVITSLTQWDSNRCFYIKNYNFETIPDCHYETNKLNEALIVKGKLTEDGEQIKFDIPNILLCHKEKITAYIYQNSNEKEITESKTVYVVSFEVLRRIKPSDYVYTATEAFSYNQLSKKVDDLSQIVNSNTSSQQGGTVTYEIPKEYYNAEFFAFDRNNTTDPNISGIKIYIPTVTIRLADIVLDSVRYEADLESGIIEDLPEEVYKLPIDEQIPIFEEHYKDYMTVSTYPWCPKTIKPWMYYAISLSDQIVPMQQLFRNAINIQVEIKREHTEEKAFIVANPNLLSADSAAGTNAFYPSILVGTNNDENFSTIEFSILMIGDCPKYLSDSKYATAADTIEEVTLTFIPNNTFMEANKNESI